ncbi:rfaE bifunctional protein [Halothece sp. PCC 7418]|uniref:bifunctional heptose 7-phosphate kinase/heptose 1-phosphate adenyltransferase n=1 Tax=Halothece sp. (strain PCC 7418) TaxID=65093 RepID=UPI0002A07F3D|nr:PfkB family carbohydrate kinase [Halothece sp. PCC 7418]AFZ43221.1 rfaE bifunctional protein [Halothece sp. PCC 7418]
MTEFFTQLEAHSQRLFNLLAAFEQPSILVVGDLALDEFVSGGVERLSREAPVLILRHEKTVQIPGGGGNAVYNLAKLGAKVKVAGLIGDDPQGTALKEIFADAGIDTTGMIPERDRATVTKTRISGHARQSVTQQIVRLDRKSDVSPSQQSLSQIADFVKQSIKKVDAVVCSDYGDGVLSLPVITSALSHHCTVVDAQKDLSRYQGATLFTPNLPEAEAAVGYSISNEDLLDQAGNDLLQLTQAQYILMTRGEQGMSLFSNTGEVHHIPPFNRTDVFDVTGAGDTVVAALTLSLCAGGTPWEAAVLGNLAASIVVRQFGTATTNVEEMKLGLQTLLDDPSLLD